MAFVHLCARLLLVEWRKGPHLSPLGMTSSCSHFDYWKADACICPCRPFDHPKASLWGTSIWFSLLSVTERKISAPNDGTKNQTKVIFCCWGFSFAILCSDVLWHQDEFWKYDPSVPTSIQWSTASLWAFPYAHLLQNKTLHSSGLSLKKGSSKR